MGQNTSETTEYQNALTLKTLGDSGSTPTATDLVLATTGVPVIVSPSPTAPDAPTQGGAGGPSLAVATPVNPPQPDIPAPSSPASVDAAPGQPGTDPNAGAVQLPASPATVPGAVVADGPGTVPLPASMLSQMQSGVAGSALADEVAHDSGVIIDPNAAAFDQAAAALEKVQIYKQTLSLAYSDPTAFGSFISQAQQNGTLADFASSMQTTPDALTKLASDLQAPDMQTKSAADRQVAIVTVMPAANQFFFSATVTVASAPQGAATTALGAGALLGQSMALAGCAESGQCDAELAAQLQNNVSALTPNIDLAKLAADAKQFGLDLANLNPVALGTVAGGATVDVMTGGAGLNAVVGLAKGVFSATVDGLALSAETVAASASKFGPAIDAGFEATASTGGVLDFSKLPDGSYGLSSAAGVPGAAFASSTPAAASASAVADAAPAAGAVPATVGAAGGGGYPSFWSPGIFGSMKTGVALAPDTGSGSGGVPGALLDNSNQAQAIVLQERAQELQSLREGWMLNNGTTAVVNVVSNATGEVQTWVATESPKLGPGDASFGGALSSAELFINGAGHAEQTIVNNLNNEWSILAGGTSRNICNATCAPLLNGAGTTLGGPAFRGMPDKTLFRMFWSNN